MNVGSTSQTASLCLTLSFVNCHCKSRPDCEQAPVSFNKLFILTLYLCSMDEYFLSSIVSGRDLAEKDVGDFIKDVSFTIAKTLLRCEASQEDENHAFL